MDLLIRGMYVMHQSHAGPHCHVNHMRFSDEGAVIVVSKFNISIIKYQLNISWLWVGKFFQKVKAALFS